MFSRFSVLFAFVMFFAAGCTQKKANRVSVIKPVLQTEVSEHDIDDPAIWINEQDLSKSLIIGTQKIEEHGGLLVFDLNGKLDPDKTVHDLDRPNNVDIEYGLMLNGLAVDIAVTTERKKNRLRVFSLPDMKPVDNGGIPVFEDDSLRAPMGIALYKRPYDKQIFAVVSRKAGPSGSYLYQYLLKDDGKGNVIGEKVRAFGAFSGNGEIEAIAVDDQLGYIYYSDEGLGIRKYYADPDHAEAATEISNFGHNDFKEDREGISILHLNDTTGYILVSNQQDNAFNVYPREGDSGTPHSHTLLKKIYVSTLGSDGSEITHRVLDPRFPSGLFVAMSDHRTFHYYSWKDMAGDDLKLPAKE